MHKITDPAIVAKKWEEVQPTILQQGLSISTHSKIRVIQREIKELYILRKHELLELISQATPLRITVKNDSSIVFKLLIRVGSKRITAAVSFPSRKILTFTWANSKRMRDLPKSKQKKIKNRKAKSLSSDPSNLTEDQQKILKYLFP